MNDYIHPCFNDVNRAYYTYYPTGEIMCGVCETILYGQQPQTNA